VVAGVGGPTATEPTARPISSVEEGEKGRGGEEEKNHASSHIPHLTPLADDDDEEVSWQSAARASLEKNKPLSVKPPVAKQPEPTPRAQKTPEKPERLEQPTLSTKPSSPSSPLPPSSSSSSPQAQPQPPEELPPIEAQFTQEELPADFWSSASEPPPASESTNDELFETATSAPSQRLERNFGQTRPSKAVSKLPFDMPLFNELQVLFPGKIIRIDMKQQKQTEESEENPAPSTEAVNVVESEENES
jgi:hypothetical protein